MAAPKTFADAFTERVSLEAFPFCAGNRGFTKEVLIPFTQGACFLR